MKTKGLSSDLDKVEYSNITMKWFAEWETCELKMGLIQKVESPYIRVIWKNLLFWILESHQTFPRNAAPRESLMTEGIPKGKFFRQSLRTYHRFSDFRIKTAKNMRPRLAPRVNTEHILVLLQWSLTVLDPDFTGAIRNSVQCASSHSFH